MSEIDNSIIGSPGLSTEAFTLLISKVGRDRTAKPADVLQATLEFKKLKEMEDTNDILIDHLSNITEAIDKLTGEMETTNARLGELALVVNESLS